MNVSVSILDWHNMAMKGSVPPARIVLNGNSMFPLVRSRRDYVTINQLDSKPVKGDIVLFSDPQISGRYVVHRVWKIRKGYIRTWGDHCQDMDAWIPETNVWGKVSLIERGHLNIKPNAKRGILWAEFWHRLGKAYRLIGRYWHGYLDEIRRKRDEH